MRTKGEPCPHCGHRYWWTRIDMSDPNADEFPLIAVCEMCRRNKPLVATLPEGDRHE